MIVIDFIMARFYMVIIGLFVIIVGLIAPDLMVKILTNAAINIGEKE